MLVLQFTESLGYLNKMINYISRWIQKRELEKDLRIIKDLPSEARALVYEQTLQAVARIEMEYKTPVVDILQSSSFHPIEDSGWATTAITINQNYRLPLMGIAKEGNDLAALQWLSYGVLLHSVRAVIDYEFRGSKDMLYYCCSMWYYLADGKMEMIPKRFRKAEST